MTHSRGLPRPLAALDAFSDYLGKALSWLILAMMAAQFLIVVLRYAFSINSIPLQESIMYMHALVFLLAAAFTLKHDGHVRVDIFYRDMSPRKKAWVDLLGTVFLLLPVMIFTIAASLGYVAKSWAIFEGSPDAGGIHGVFLLKTLIPLFAGLMIVQGLVEILRNALIISGRLDPSAKDHDAADEERL